MKYLTDIYMFVVTTIIGILIWYFKRNEDRHDKDGETLELEISSIKKDVTDCNNNLSNYKLEAQKEFVTKDEFVRAISNQDKKLDKIYDELLKMNRKTS